MDMDGPVDRMPRTLAQPGNAGLKEADMPAGFSIRRYPACCMHRDESTKPGIHRVAPPAAIADRVTAFIERDEWLPPCVQRLLPEPRASIQLRIAEPFAIRERDGAWQTVPRISLWGPRRHWCHGYASGHVHVYGFGLSAAGLHEAGTIPARDLVDRVIDLEISAPELAAALRAHPGEGFTAWRTRVGALWASRHSTAQTDGLRSWIVQRL